MARFASYIWLMIGLLLPVTAWGGQQSASAVDTAAMMKDDYIRASLLSITPDAEVYSIFGHCALRLQCPSQQMDYCFTFETSTDTEGIVNFFRGNSLGGFAPAPTPDYLEYYRQQGRGITEYVLNMTPEEKLELWRIVDDEIAKGFTHDYGYMHNQCTSMIVSVVNRALATCIKYSNLPAELDGSFRDLMVSASENYPWSRFFWQTIMGPEGDETEPLAHKLIPQLLPVAWEKATVGSENRRLIKDPGTKIVQEKVNTGASNCWLSPLTVFTLLLLFVLLVSYFEWTKGWRKLPRTVDAVLLVCHTIVSLFLTWLVLFSTQEGTSWNWYLVVFNPLPLLLWVLLPGCRVWVCRCFLLVLLVFVGLMCYIPQLDLPHILIVASLSVRLFMQIKRITK